MKLSDLLQRADEVLALGQEALSSVRKYDFGDYLAEDKFAAFRAAALSFLANVFGSVHPYYKDFDAGVSHPQPSYALTGGGIVSAARGELAGDKLRTTRGLITAEIFADFLEMAERL